MANNLVTPTKIAREALFHLENNLVMGSLVHREYKDEFVDPKAGGTVTIRKPVRFVASDGATRVNQDVVETTTTIQVGGTVNGINQRKHVSWEFNTQDLTLTIEEYGERYIRGACVALANAIDVALCKAAAVSFWMNVGTPGTTPASFGALGDLAQRLDENAVPQDMRRTILNPAANWKLADALKGIDNQSMNEEFVRKGYLGHLAAADIYMDQNVYSLSTGSGADRALAVDEPSATNLVEGTTVMDMDSGTSGNTLYAGDKFTIAGVNAINPVSKADLGYLQEFTVTADNTASGTQHTDVSFAPAIYTSSSLGLQSVSAMPADGAACTFKGSESAVYPMNFGFHRNALALVNCPLILPDSCGFKARVTHRGLSIRVIKDYDVTNDVEVIRLDVLFGVKAIYPDLGCVLWG